MNLDDFINAIEAIPGRGFRLDNNQKIVISHGDGPLWVIAGPGSGKTDSIVFRCLKLLVVDKVSPASIILTTFPKPVVSIGRLVPL